MTIRNEIKKFGVSSIFIFIYSLYYNTGHFRGDFFYGLHASTIGIFDDLEIIFYAILFFLAGYILFNLFYIIIYFLLKVLRSNKDILHTSIILIAGLFSFYIINDQLILHQLRDYDYSNSHYLPVDNELSIIDSTNFTSYSWYKKSIDYSSKFIINEQITFNSDSSLTRSGFIMHYDELLFFRKLLNIKKVYSINRKYIYGNFIFVQDSADSKVSVQVRYNRLYLNVQFFK